MALPSDAADVNLAWNANQETDIAGYKVHYGTTTGNLNQIRDVGNSTVATLTGLAPTTPYFCAVQAYSTSGLTSELSAQISFTTSADAVPEIAVERPVGTNLVDGTGSTAFGNVTVGTSGAPVSFTIRNLGTANLTGLALTKLGTHPGDFLLSAIGATTLAPGASTTFTVTFKPTATGTRSASLRIASNDANENPFDISLTGSGLAAPPVTLPEIAVERPVGTNLVDGTASTAFGNVTVGTSGAPVSFTIRNLGTANLTGLALTKLGTHPGDFLLSAIGATTLAPGASTTFTVTFKPTATGTRSASLRIASNDANENPFDISLTGSGLAAPPVAVPEIAVERPVGTNLVDGTASTAFGNVTVGTSGAPVSFTIRNLGTANLTGLALTKVGTHSGDFLLSAIGATTLAPGASTTFTVTFKPTATGTRSASLRIASNDANENPFDISLTGSGLAAAPIAVPEIAVERPVGTNLVDGTGSTAFGNVTVGTSGAPVSFTIRNLGTANLTGLALTKLGTHPGDFLLSAIGATTLAPGASTTFTVTFKPTATGTRSASLRIASNDANENPFDIALTGAGIAPVLVVAPEIAVARPGGADLIDGSATASLGNVNLRYSGPVETFTITNRGNANLTGLASVMTGANPKDFLFSKLPAALAPGASATLSVIFKPLAAGQRSASLQIYSNDADERPFDITISGNGVAAPEIAVERPVKVNLVDGVASTAFGNVNIGASGLAVTYIVRNLGTADLTGMTLSNTGANPGDFVIGALGASTLVPGGVTTFTVSFKPTGSGARAATLQLVSNDSDENPFDIQLLGNGVPVPDIAVERPAGTNLVDAIGNSAFGDVNIGSSSPPMVFTVRNQGTAALTGMAFAMKGVNPYDFKVTPLAATTLAPGASTTFSVTFSPLAGKARSAVLQLYSNDLDERPFDMVLIGNGIPVPEIAVEQPLKTNLVDGASNIAFGSVNLGATGLPVTFIVRNPGTANLSGLAITAVGANPGDFTVGPLGATILAPGKATVFTVTFKPTAGGSRAATLRLVSNDADESPFDIGLSGNGVPVPEIAVADSLGADLVDLRNRILYGNVNLGSSSAARTFTIRNTGTANLTGLAITANAYHPGDFIIGSLGSTSLAPGQSTTFTATFRPTAAGTRGTILQLASNDADENPFDIVLIGAGIPIPEIAVENAAGTNLSAASARAGFGNVNLGSSGQPVTFTVRNLGTANLAGLGILMKGLHPKDFLFSKLPAAIAPGKSASFVVVFKPTATGSRSATLELYSNDADERPFVIALTGTSGSTAIASFASPVAADETTSAAPATSSPEPAGDQPVTSVIWIGDMKYNCITIPKTAGTVADSNAVEVSPDLVNWFSGVNFTTVVVDNESILQVRDNTPLTPESKRYIRLAVRY